MRTLFCCILFSLLTTVFGETAVPPVGDGTLRRGWNEMPFPWRQDGREKNIRPHVYLPDRAELQDLPVLIVIHGAGGGEAGKNPASGWTRIAEAHGLLVIAPAFAYAEFPAAFYQFAGLSRTWGAYDPLPETERTGAAVEAIFDRVRRAAGIRAERYYLYGMSAGGQFIHRFLLGNPDARVIRAVIGSPGSWTFAAPDGQLDDSGKIYGWPDTVSGTPLADPERLKKYLGLDLRILLGDADNARQKTPANPDYGFMATPGAMAQGAGRCDRGRHAFDVARRTAERLGTPFRWRLTVLPGVRHNSSQVIRGTAAPGPVSVDACTEEGAYRQLFGDVPRR